MIYGLQLDFALIAGIAETCLYHEVMEPYHFVNVPYGFAVVHQLQMAPFNYLFYGNVTETPIPNDARKFILKRSVFDLVKLYRVLELTDPKLLCWYLSLPPGDRKLIQDEGGFHQFLQRHPALELGKQHVYVKHDTGCFTQLAMSSNLNRPTFNKVISCLTCGAKNLSGALNCRHCNISFQGQTLSSEKVQNSNLLTPCGYQANSQEANTQLGLAQCRINQLLNRFHHSSKEVELKQNDQRLTIDSVDLVKDQNTVSGCHSLDGADMVPTRCDDDAINFLSVEPEHETLKQVLMQPVSVDTGPGQLGGATGQSTLPGDVSPICGSDWACQEGSERLHSIMQEDESILLYKAAGTRATGGHRGAPASVDDALPPVSKMAVGQSAAKKSPSTLPPVDACDKSMGTDQSLTPCQPTATQTDAPATAAKGVTTVLRMTDLDYVVEEFRKLKLAQRELQELKVKMTSGGYDQRAQKAELSLLALQLGICQQHCWRHYYTSPDGDRFTHMQGDRPTNLPESLASVLHVLQSDYEEMRGKILAGVPLDQLQPLSVDSHKLGTGGPFFPVQITGDALENKHIWSQETNTFDGRSQELESQDSGAHRCKDSQEAHTSVPQAKLDGWKSGRGVSLHCRSNGSSSVWRVAETAACKQELSPTEDWYDAEEDLEPSQPAEAACPADMGQPPPGSTGSARDLTEPRGTLYVSGLPTNATEGDVELWFEKYAVTDVNVTQSQDGMRVALVWLHDPQLANRAVREMSGFSVQGSVLRVQHVDKPDCRRNLPASCTIPSSPPEVATASQSSETSTPPQLVSVQEDWLSERRRITSDKPTAKGTCVPQCYASMAGFDTLMALLAERHPQVERQKFVDALEEVVAKHEPMLIRLPLASIADMISDVLKTS